LRMVKKLHKLKKKNVTHDALMVSGSAKRPVHEVTPGGKRPSEKRTHMPNEDDKGGHGGVVTEGCHNRKI